MCGIFAVILNEGHAVREDLLHRANDLLAHRGPNDRGVYVSPDRRVGLAQTRLSIVDLAHGHQPMASASGQTWLTYNGEIYNHADLRARLEEKGVPFHTACDTEVLVNLADREGLACLDRLEGMFAFVAYHETDGRVFGARDRLGQKPLFWLERPEGIYLASEIRPLLLAPGYEPAVDPEALQEYFNYYLPLAPRTLLRDIRKIPPGCRFQRANGTLRIEPYWRPDYRRKRTESEGELVEECRHLLRRAVRKRLMSDVPLGSMLSGGLDSSAVSALAQEETGGALKTFSAFYRDPAGRDMDWDYAQLVARHLGTRHENLLYDADGLWDELPHVVRHFGEPYGSFNGTISLAISRLMKQHVTVVLSGNGGDEAFAGYNTYRQAAWLDGPLARATLPFMPSFPFRSVYRRLSRGWPRFDRKWLALYWLGRPDRFTQSIAHSECFLRKHLFSDVLDQTLPPAETSLLALFHGAKADTVLDRWTCADLLGRMQENMVLRSDFTGMAVALEIRAPLLDHALVEFAASLPADLRMKNGRVGKHLLREAARPWLPPELFTRRKQGFSGITYPRLIDLARGAWKERFAAALFERPAPLTAGLFRPGGVESLWQRLHQEPPDSTRATRLFQFIWMLVSLRVWENEISQGLGN